MDADELDRIKRQCENQREDIRRMRATANLPRRFAHLAYQQSQNMRAAAHARGLPFTQNVTTAVGTAAVSQ
jgi:hypothetical protein